MPTNTAVTKRLTGAAPKSGVWVRGLDDGTPEFAEKVLTIFQPDILISSQFLEVNKRNTYLEPERVLMLAVLRDAVACYQDPSRATKKRKKALSAEAAKWLFADDSSYPFSCLSICDALGLDANYLRRGLRSWRDAGFANGLARMAS